MKQTGLRVQGYEAIKERDEESKMKGESGSAHPHTKFTSQAESERRVCMWYL
jgi:hypothetical protein